MPRRCRQCREHNIPKDAPKTQFVCGVPCSIAYGKKINDKRRAQIAKAKDKADREKVRGFRLKDKVHQLKLTQAAVNKLCGLLDKGRPCISCGRPDGGGRLRNASHLKSRGANSGLRFDLRNLHMSCTRCNLFLSGHLVGFREGIQERYGQAMLDYLDSAPRLKEWAVSELVEIRAVAHAEIRRIESGQPPSRDWRALDNSAAMPQECE